MTYKMHPQKESPRVNQAVQIGKRIAAARKAKHMTQERLGERLGVSFQAVSTWEQGKFIPDPDHLPMLAEVLDISLDALFSKEEYRWEMKPVNYDFSHMFSFVKGRAQMMNMGQTLRVLDMLRYAHGAQERKSKFGFATTYMVHPLTMACHALAMGLRDDDIIASCLAHDMVEDSDIKLSDLPVNERVREVVRLVSYNTYDESRPDLDDVYFAHIRQNPLACLIKCLDRCNNMAGMADCFTRKRMAKYTALTDQYYPALLDVIKKVPEWNDAWWLLRYQLMTMTETFKRLL